MDRSTIIKKYKNDDVAYISALFYSVLCQIDRNFKNLSNILTENDIDDFLDTACMIHCTPFEQNVEEYSNLFINKFNGKKFIDEGALNFCLDKKKYVSLSKAFNVTGIIKRFVCQYVVQIKLLDEAHVMWKLFHYGVADEMCFNKESALMITPSNIILDWYKDVI